MGDTLAKAVLHLLNWIAASLAFSFFFPRYGQIAGLLAFPSAVLALGCAVLIAALSLLSEEA